MPHDFLGVDHLAVDHRRHLAVGAAGVKANAAAVHITADGPGLFIGLRTLLQRQVDDLHVLLVKFKEKVAVKGTPTLGRIHLLQLFGNVAAAADVHPEAADGPQQKLHVPFHKTQVGLSRLGAVMDVGTAHTDQTVVALHRNGDGVCSAFFVLGHPTTEGDEIRIQLGPVLHVIGYTQIVHVFSPFRRPSKWYRLFLCLYYSTSFFCILSRRN